MYPRNNASPLAIAVGQVVQISDGAVQTTAAAARVKIGTGDWGASAGALACDATSGCWYYTPSQAETNAESFIVAVYKAACLGCQVTVVTTAAPVAGQVVPADDAITAAKFDESTAFPLKSADTGATAVARTGADSDTLETLSDQLDTVTTAVGSLYWAAVRHVVDDTESKDLWTVVPMKDGVAQTSATSVVLNAYKRDGTKLIDAKACSQIGATEEWTYDAETTERINDGNDMYRAVVTFTCDAGSRTAPPVIIARDG